jgi:hypothetical protein
MPDDSEKGYGSIQEMPPWILNKLLSAPQAPLSPGGGFVPPMPQMQAPAPTLGAQGWQRFLGNIGRGFEMPTMQQPELAGTPQQSLGLGNRQQRFNPDRSIGGRLNYGF